MNVLEILDKADVLTGQRVEVEGFLVYLMRSYYLAPNSASKELMERSVLMADQDAVKQLRGRVSMWVGGPAYQDEVRVTGVIRRSSVSPFPLQLDAVSSFVLTRNGETFQVV